MEESYDAKYLKRFDSLNKKQQDAVKATEGPVAVIAGPGTGKTELVGMRVANILRTSDTAPENILCLTFTDSGVVAMRQRLLEIIGADAHKVNIYTFHSFGSNIMNQNLSLFFDDLPFKPASTLMTHEILSDIFETLPHGHMFAAKGPEGFMKISRVKGAISDLKKGGLTSEELQKIITANQIDLDSAEKILSPIAEERATMKAVDQFSEAALELNKLENIDLPNNTPSFIEVLKNSLLRAIQEADALNKPAPITKWKKQWFEKDSNKKSVLKSRKKLAELKEIKKIYEKYIDAMNKAQLYDYDDMILMTLAALKNNKELLYNLQEKYQYILIDEFQDTNQAQMQIIYQLISDTENRDEPNILIVGDDDQAIYGFQGADSSNITTFLNQLPKTKLITLTDNYRSSQKILDHARNIILRGEDRLENVVEDLDKTLTAKNEPEATAVKINNYSDIITERFNVARNVKELIESGVKPSQITILARKHAQLIDILPYFSHYQIPVSYEKHDNALDIDSIIMLEKLTDLFVLINNKQIAEAETLLPEILSHPAWGLEPKTIWEIASRSYKEKMLWIETLNTIPETTKIYNWLIKTSSTIFNLPLEQALDVLIGNVDTSSETGKAEEDKGAEEFKSPFYNYFFSKDILEKNPQSYLLHLNALGEVRNKLKEYYEDDANVNLESFTNFIKLNREIKEVIPINQSIETLKDASVNLMTAHKAKGLEFDYVFIIDAVDNNWGSAVRANNNTYKFPENTHLNRAGENLDERIRLFYVAATRAKKGLYISYSNLNEKSKNVFKASFLEGDAWQTLSHAATSNIDELIKKANIDWSKRITMPDQNLKDLLKSTLQNYKLNSTALNNFIDVTRGGPQHFLMQNLLHFPQSPSIHSAYGTAVHNALQAAHLHLIKHGKLKPTEDIIADFEEEMQNKPYEEAELQKFIDRGAKSLQAFLNQKNDFFRPTQRPEINFYDQQAVFDEVPLTGKTDVLEADKQSKTISITDYKTGRPSDSWKGKAPYQKVALHKYKQQLMFYQLLIENSRDYYNYNIKDSLLSFVEPDKEGNIHTLSAEYSPKEYEHFKKLVKAVYTKIINLDLPDISPYSEDLDGIIAFENDLTDSLK